MKKIVFLLPNLEAGGAERVLLNYSRILDSTKFEMTLIVIKKDGDLQSYIPKNVDLIDLNITRARKAYIPLIKSINSVRPDFIVSTTNNTNLLVLLGKYFYKGQPKIIIREPNTPSAQFGEKYLDKTHFRLMKYLYPKTDLMIAQTLAMKSELIQLFSVPEKKIKVIQNPIDTKFIDNQKNKSFDSFDKTKINIVASGRLHRQKGFDFLIDTFAEVVKQNGNIRLHILGKLDGRENCTKEIKSQINKLNLNEYVKLWGFQSNPYIFYKNADLFVLSSRWEGLPNVVLENLYLGTPVVATRCVPILSELIIDEKNGKLVENENIDQMSDAIMNYENYNEKIYLKSNYTLLKEIFQ